ncbi:hypothetical protein MAR_019496, partial [Mya arenaria]
MMGKCGAQKNFTGISWSQEILRNFLVPTNSQEVPGLQKFSGVSWFQEYPEI